LQLCSLSQQQLSLLQHPLGRFHLQPLLRYVQLSLLR
jgi:hypothetical protein